MHKKISSVKYVFIRIASKKRAPLISYCGLYKKKKKNPDNFILTNNIFFFLALGVSIWLLSYSINPALSVCI